MTDYLAATMAMLGPAQNRYADPSAWDRLHADPGIRLPPDHQVIVDAYAPIQLNGHLYLSHPATERWNLVQWIRDTIRAWSEVPWDELDLDADEDPRQPALRTRGVELRHPQRSVADREHRPRRDGLPWRGRRCHLARRQL